MSIVYEPKWPFYSCWDYIGLLGTGFMQVLYLGRAPRTKETLPDFLKWRRVTQHPLVFRGLTGSQQTPRVWGVTDAGKNFLIKSSRKSAHVMASLIPGGFHLIPPYMGFTL